MSTIAARNAPLAGTLRPLVRGAAWLLAAEILLAAACLAFPAALALRAWLVAFAVASSVPIGSTVLLMIHRLTGGDWGFAIAPVLRPAAAMMPLVALAFLPVLLGISHLYGWAAAPATVPADVARWYLNAPLFWLRALVALAGWSLLGMVFATGAAPRLFAAAGLAFHGFAASAIAIDWYLSLDPHYEATAFAATVAIQQMLAALAVAVLLRPPTTPRTAGDLCGLLMSTLLGVVYLAAMSYIVAWYGDLPDKAAWFLARDAAGWIALVVTAVAVGAAAPFAMLMRKDVRQGRRGLRVAALLILFGITAHCAWLLVPGATAAAAVVIGGIVCLAALAAVAWRVAAPLRSALENVDAE